MGGAPDRIDTIIDFEAVERHGVHGQGTHAIATADALAELAELAANREVEIPIARTYPLERVRDAFEELTARHTHGKIVLIP